MKQAHVIAANTLIIWGTTVLQIIPPLIMVPFLIRNLGDAGYGEYALIWSLLMAIEQLEVSLQSGGIKYGAAFLAQGRIGELNKVLSSTFVFALGLGVLSCLAIGLAAALSFSASHGLMISLMIVGVMMIFLAPTTPYLGIIRAKQRHYIISVAAIVSQYAGLLFAFLWFRFVGPSVEALIAILAGTLLISRLVQVPVAYRLVPGLRNRPRDFDKTTFRMILGFGSMVVLLSLCLAANSTGMRWLAGMLVSTSFVAHLAIFLMPAAMLAQVIQAMTITVMPAASAYEASENHTMLRELFLKSTRYTVVLVSAGLLAALILVRNVLRLWVGPSYEFLDVYTMINLAGVGVLMCGSAAHQMLKGLGALRRILAAFVIGLVAVPVAVFAGLHAAGVSPYMAVSVALLLGNITAGVLQLRACARRIEMDRTELVLRGFVQPLAPAAAGLALAFGIFALTGLGGLAGRTAVAVAAVALVFGIFYLFVAGPEERRQFREFVLMVRERLGGILGRSSARKESPDA
ncbi:MAG: lipopolysaccharide biosynthesis protein [Candidatus Aminicenantales bacterium]